MKSHIFLSSIFLSASLFNPSIEKFSGRFKFSTGFYAYQIEGSANSRLPRY